MTELTTLFFSLMITFVGVAIGFIFGWFGSSYFSAFVESTHEEQIHPEMIDDQGFIINEELFSVRFIEGDETISDYDED